MNSTGCPLTFTNFVALLNIFIDLLKVHASDIKDDTNHRKST